MLADLSKDVKIVLFIFAEMEKETCKYMEWGKVETLHFSQLHINSECETKG